jgi:hypothetical protein
LICFKRRPDAGRRGQHLLLDPCAGKGEAIATLRRAWFEDADAAAIAACEMEASRAGALAADLSWRDQRLHADAFTLTWRPSDHGASIVLLNPPYDTDPDFGRLEERFLRRFQDALAPGGALMFLVPVASLAASAATLARGFTDHRVFRFPDPEYDEYRQCVLVARRAAGEIPGAAEVRARIERWAASPGSLTPLPERAGDPLVVPAGDYGLDLAVTPFDHRGTTEAFRPWDGVAVGTDLEVGDLIGRRFPTALPPKPAHLALALAAGHFNGHRLEADEPERLPPILVKGVYTRELVEVEERTNKDGEVTGVVHVEQPRLRLHALRLDRYRFFEPGPGSEPSGATRLEAFNTADVLDRYSGSLTRLMARQFPPLHSPARESDQVALPPLPRTPYECQRHAIQAALKLLALGKNPQLVSEVGTGKTTMALYVAAALSGVDHARTCSELTRVGLDASRLPRVHRALVVCPPHLLQSWTDQAAAVVPSAQVRVLRTLSDLPALDEPAPAGGGFELYVLSREAAKLGHGFIGLSGRCPRCGAAIPESAEDNARKRLRCQAVHAEPWNPWAEIAEGLAAALVPVLPEQSLVRRLVARWPVLAKRARGGRLGTLDAGRIRSLLRQVLAELGAVLKDPASGWEARSKPVAVAVALARAIGAEGETALAFDALAEAAGSKSPYGPSSHARDGAQHLRSAETVDHRERLLLDALKALCELGRWHKTPSYELSRRRHPPGLEAERCGEPLFQAAASPRRFPIARFVTRYRRRSFDLLILDEVHEFSNLGTAQQKAAHRLAELGMPVLALTGSIMGGYASSLFANMWALDHDFRREFPHDAQSAFCRRYGFQKVLVSAESKEKLGRPVDFGACSDRESRGVRVLGEAPGVLPLFLLRHLLPSGILVHKEDLEIELPPMREHPVALTAETTADHELLAEYRRLSAKLADQIRRDLFTPMAGKLWGAMLELPSYLDRATEDLGPFEIRYPEDCDLNGALIAEGRAFPTSTRTPKERWLVETVRQGLREGRRLLVFLRHTGTAALPNRLLKILRAEATPSVAWLNAQRVPAQRREAWIDEHVIAPDVKVLLVNPNAVRTGLNNLVGFSIAVWYELDYDARTYRQANGRLHRIGQRREVDVYFPVFAGTAQDVALQLVARKVTASLQVDGLSVQGALEAAGAGDDSRAALAMAIGRAIYEKLKAA